MKDGNTGFAIWTRTWKNAPLGLKVREQLISTGTGQNE